MLTHEEMIGLQAEKHDLIDAHNFHSREEYVLHLIHSFAYVQASTFAKDKTVLDFACNTGYGTEILSKTAKRVVGVDVSKKAISTARKQYSHPGIDFQLIDGKQLPFSDNDFDIVTNFQIIEHIVDYNVYLNELKRVLSPLGAAIFTTPNALIRLDPGMKPLNKFHVREFDNSELQTLLNAHFSDVHILGLFAEEPLYLIEKNRVNEALEAARRYQQHKNYYRIRSVAKKMIPNYILNKLKSFLAASSQSNQEIDKTFIETHGIGDLYYREDDLITALDLLAICTDDVNISKGIKQMLKMNSQGALLDFQW